MEPPFFYSHYKTPTSQPYCRPTLPKQSPPTQTTPSKPRKVISIPIHYVDGGRTRPDSAVKIQKAFRGFRVRKTVKKILELKREVDGVERKLQDEATMAMIRRDGLERLRVSECLMALLFKLDSVPGFNDEIRAFRKVVIRKAIMLQELVDSAAKVEERESEVIDDEDVKNSENSQGIDEKFEEANETPEKSEALDDSSKMQVEDSAESIKEADNAMVVETIASAATDDSWESLGRGGGGGGAEEQQKSDFEDDNGGGEDCGERKRPSNEEWCVVNGAEEEEEEERKKEKLLEKMAEDNQKLMAMVAELCQKNTMQTRMIASLSQRVEHLEKAMSDRLRKKKKKSNASLI